MIKQEKRMVLEECEQKLAEIDLKKEQADREWESIYNRNYRLSFTMEDIANKVVTTKVGGGILIVSGAAIYALSRSWALSIGIPSAGGLIAILGNVSLIVSNGKKKMEYWKELRYHEKVKNSLEEERYPYQIVSHYLKDGKTFLLHQYRRNLDSSTVPVDEEADELDYLDIDTKGLSPLMIKALAEMRAETVELSTEIKTALIDDINAMHTRIIEADFPVSFLQEYQKVLTKYAPPVESTTLTSK